jgi:hypothetical protein
VLEAVDVSSRTGKASTDTAGIEKYLKSKWPTHRWVRAELTTAVKDALLAGLLVRTSPLSSYFKIGRAWDGTGVPTSSKRKRTKEEVDSAVVNHNADRAAKGQEPLSRKRAMEQVCSERAFGASVAAKTMPAALRQKVDAGEILPVTAMLYRYAERAFDGEVAAGTMSLELQQRVSADKNPILKVTAMLYRHGERAFDGEVAAGTMSLELQQRVSADRNPILKATAVRISRADRALDRNVQQMLPALEAARERANKEIAAGEPVCTAKPRRAWDANACAAHFEELDLGTTGPFEF